MAQTVTLNTLSITPRYFTKGDTVTVTMTVKNNSSRYTVDTLQPELILTENIGTLNRVRVVDWGGLNVSLGAGKTATYSVSGICRDFVYANHSTVTEAIEYMNSNGVRCLGSDNMYFDVSAWFSNGDGDAAEAMYSALTTKLGGQIGLLNRHLPGSLVRANLQRCAQSGTQYVPDDEGTYIRSDIAFTLGSGFNGSNVTTKQIVVTGDAGTSKTITISAAQLNNMISSTGYTETGAGGLIPGAYSNGENLSFRFRIGDAYETMTFTATVARAFANVHMSGCATGGGAFGKFSSSALNHPLFECEYPAVFNGGVVVNWSTPTLASGITTPNGENTGNGSLRAGKIGDRVFIRGGVQVTPKSSAVLIATLPQGYAPQVGSVYKLAPCTAGRVAKLYVATDGSLYLDAVYSFGSSSKYTSSVWVDCSFEYWQ